jgi:septal ring factor EnvC (AmiA/AmiB activator)
MNASAEQRSTGPLVAFIDLLFLLVGLFVLMLFFLQEQRTEAQAELEQTQQELETAQSENSALEAVVAELEPFMGAITAFRGVEEEQRREQEARELRKRQKETYRLDYEVLPDGRLLHDGRGRSARQFAAEVVAPLRERHWIAFRARARPDTPFGSVVESRRILLESRQEFDTYWDNLAPERPEP